MRCGVRFLLACINGISSEDASADEGNGSSRRSNPRALSSTSSPPTLQIPADHVADDLIQEVLLIGCRQVTEGLRELIEGRAREVSRDGPAVIHAAVGLHEGENPVYVFWRPARPRL